MGITFNNLELSIEAKKASLAISEGIISNSTYANDFDVDLDIDFTAKPNGKQTNIARMVDLGIGNGQRVVTWLTHPLLYRKDRKRPSNYKPSIFMVALGFGLACATVKPKNQRSEGGKFTAEMETRLKEFGISVNTNRTKLLATPKLEKLAKQFTKELEVLANIPISDNYKIVHPDANAQPKRTKLTCSDGCEFADVVSISALTDHLDTVIELKFACPDCGIKYTYQGQTDEKTDEVLKVAETLLN